MDNFQNFTYTPQSPINNNQFLFNQTHPHVSDNGFPVLPIVAVMGITATAFLLISYYIFVTKCCFRRQQQVDPIMRFRARLNEDPLMSYSPSWRSRGLDELLIQEIPTLQYCKNEGEFSICVVCLNEFQEHDILKVLPKCTHAFHLDCIDVWLQKNSNCPLCRSTISGRDRYRLERLVAPNSSPQDPFRDEDFVVIEFCTENGNNMLLDNRHQERSESNRFFIQPRSNTSRKFEHKILKSRTRKYHNFSIMGDEGINVREKNDSFSIQPIRRSFSMDSAADRHAYLSVQEIIRHNRNVSGARNNRNNEESSSRSLRHIFSFGNGRGSRNSVLPVEF